MRFAKDVTIKPKYANFGKLSFGETSRSPTKIAERKKTEGFPPPFFLGGWFSWISYLPVVNLRRSVKKRRDEAWWQRQRLAIASRPCCYRRTVQGEKVGAVLWELHGLESNDFKISGFGLCSTLLDFLEGLFYPGFFSWFFVSSDLDDIGIPHAVCTKQNSGILGPFSRNHRKSCVSIKWRNAPSAPSSITRRWPTRCQWQWCGPRIGSQFNKHCANKNVSCNKVEFWKKIIENVRGFCDMKTTFDASELFFPGAASEGGALELMRMVGQRGQGVKMRDLAVKPQGFLYWFWWAS